MERLNKMKKARAALLVNSLVLLAILLTSFVVDNTVVSALLKTFTVLQMIIALAFTYLQVSGGRENQCE